MDGMVVSPGFRAGKDGAEGAWSSLRRRRKVAGREGMTKREKKIWSTSLPSCIAESMA